MMNYKIKLKTNELQIIESISYNSKTQLILQSIYSYIVKHTTLNNGSFPKPLIDLYKMYIRYHNKISCIYFRKLIKKLVDYKMVIVISLGASVLMIILGNIISKLKEGGSVD